jgi:hypothetical protein
MGMKSALEIPFKHIAVEGVFLSRKTQLANVLGPEDRREDRSRQRRQPVSQGFLQ